MGVSFASLLRDQLENIKLIIINKMKLAIAILVAVLAVCATANVISADTTTGLPDGETTSTGLPDGETTSSTPSPITTGSAAISFTASLIVLSAIVMSLK